MASIKNLFFLGSSCIYPRLCKQPMKEKYLLTGELEKTNDAYSIAKIAGLKLCESYNHQYNLNYKLKKMTYKDFTIHIKQDKKVKSGKVRIVLLKRLSNAFVTEKFGQLNFSRAIKQHLQ